MDLLHRKKRMHLLRFSPRRPHRRGRCCLEALAVDDAGTGLVVLLLRAPEVLERRERSKNGTTDPDGVLPLRRSNNLDLFAERKASISHYTDPNWSRVVALPSYLKAREP